MKINIKQRENNWVSEMIKQSRVMKNSNIQNTGHILIEAVDENGNYGLVDILDKKHI
jgi:hypothetical protein